MNTKQEEAVRIEECPDCSLPLPLRCAKKTEVAATWECCACGARYQGVLAEDSHKKHRRNARRVSRR